MGFAELISFLSAKTILAISPGPGVLATVALSLSSGFRPALPLTAGIIIGDILYLLLTATGLSAAAQAAAEWLILIQIAGGAYFMWLGLKLCLSKPPTPNAEPPTENVSQAKGVFSGILITLSNPKVILFYYGFLPARTGLSLAYFTTLLSVILAVVSILATVLLTYALLAAQAQRRLLNNPTAVHRLHQASGGVLVVTGLLIANVLPM